MSRSGQPTAGPSSLSGLTSVTNSRTPGNALASSTRKVAAAANEALAPFEPFDTTTDPAFVQLRKAFTAVQQLPASWVNMSLLHQAGTRFDEISDSMLSSTIQMSVRQGEELEEAKASIAALQASLKKEKAVKEKYKAELDLIDEGEILVGLAEDDESADERAEQEAQDAMESAREKLERAKEVKEAKRRQKQQAANTVGLKREELKRKRQEDHAGR